MSNIKLCLNKKKKYVIACSFGPDSMALLDLAINEGLRVIVAHVNYRKRDVSQFEQDSLLSFCEQRKIPIHVLDLKGKAPKGNFQDWARKQRYEFFKKVVQEEGADAVLVAHQQDDVIETYLMQKNRGNYVKNAGICRENEIFGVKVIRPLLDYSKAELKEYDEQNNVPFSIDESNLTDHYTRNKIRHSTVEKLSQEERKALICEIKNVQVEKPETRTSIEKTEFLAKSYGEIVSLLDFFMSKTNRHRDLSEKYIDEIKKTFRNKTNHRVKITEKLWLECDTNFVYLINALKVQAYEIEVNTKTKTDFIEVDFSGGAQDRGINNLPAKFIIKNCSKTDKAIIKNYKSSIRRLFIDWKMPLFLRDIWPGIYDENGNLLYVPRYREKFVDNHKSVLKINTKYFTEF